MQFKLVLSLLSLNTIDYNYAKQTVSDHSSTLFRTEYKRFFLGNNATIVHTLTILVFSMIYYKNIRKWFR